MLEYNAFLDLLEDTLKSENVILILLLLAAVVAFVWLPIYLLRSSHRSLRVGSLLKALPTSKVRGVFMGMVEVKGTAESAIPLYSYLTGAECVYFSYSVEEHWRRVVTTTTVVNGKTQIHTRVESGWKTIDSNEQLQDFYLRDETGDLLIRPEGADIEPYKIFEMECEADHPLYFGKGPHFSIPYSTGDRRFIEHVILHHAPLYVVGTAKERVDIVAAEIVEDEDAPIYMISTRSEEDIISGKTRSGWLRGIGGLVLLVAAACILRYMGIEHSRGVSEELLNEVPLYWYVGGAYCLVWFGLWWFSVYNGLVDIKNRVYQSLSLIDVELKRRNDLIPSLVNVVESFVNYERLTQEEVANCRTGVQRLCEGEISARVLVEAYPNLRAEQLFSDLSQQLVATEDRVALAREYCLSIANYFNTRIQTFPVSLIARMFGLRLLALPSSLFGSSESKEEYGSVRIDLS